MNKKFWMSFGGAVLVFSLVFVGLSKSSYIKNIFAEQEIDDENTYDELEEDDVEPGEQLVKNEILSAVISCIRFARSSFGIS